MNGFQDAKKAVVPKLFWHDYILKYTVLPLFPKFVLPNHITIFRFLATPFVFWLLYTENYKWGIPIFFLIAFSDALDGTMARVRNRVTEWGTLYDPIADKILISSVLILLIFRHLNIYIALAIVGLEIAHVIGGLVVKMRGGEIKALFWGKAKMVSQVVGGLSLLAFLATGFAPFALFANAALGAAIFFAVGSIVVHGFRDF